VVVRSDDVDGNRVSGHAELGGRAHRFVADFSDDGEVVNCTVEP
jgi:hypothetical protein